mgnify:CR=1 FL=1
MLPTPSFKDRFRFLPGEENPALVAAHTYSPADVQAWAEAGCRSAGIGCLDCKQPVIEAVLALDPRLSSGGLLPLALVPDPAEQAPLPFILITSAPNASPTPTPFQPSLYTPTPSLLARSALTVSKV